MNPQVVQHAPFYWHTVVAVISGGGFVRFAAYVSNAVPPLPVGAGWWSQFGYQLLKGLSGVDPNTPSAKQKP